ncbi:class I SAM-dependent methyltransferase [Flindersiella endophytica]
MARRPDPADLTEAIRSHWDEMAPRYDRSMDSFDRFLIGDGRAWACSKADGRTLEVAIGTGRNLPLYPDTVELTGIDFSPRMLDLARRRARSLGSKVDLREADAQRMPFEDGRFDTVVSTLSMCSVPDLAATIAEMRRVLRPGGRLVLLDHVRPTAPPLLWLLQVVQWFVNRFRPTSGEQFLRRPLPLVEAAGFVVEEQERSKGGAVERLVARLP